MGREEVNTEVRSEPIPMAPVAGTRIAVVGGCGGFGSALVKDCLLREHRIALLDLPASLERHGAPDGVELALPVDATDETSLQSAFGEIGDRWGAIDALVFLVGFTMIPPTRLEDVDADAWDNIQIGNLRSAHLTANAALPLLKASGEAAIVTISTSLAYATLPGFGPYSAAKAGLIGLTKALALENAPWLRANSIAPTASLTPFVAGGTGRGGEDADLDWFDHQSHARNFPLGRLCEPEDVIGSVLFLAGPASSYLTGQVIHLNGGKLMP